MALLGFGLVTLITVAALFGSFVENAAVRWIGAGILTFGIPAALSDRVLVFFPRLEQKTGVVSDLLALSWALFSTLVVGVFGTSSATALVTESKRLAAMDQPALSSVARFLARGTLSESAQGGSTSNAATSGSAVAPLPNHAAPVLTEVSPPAGSVNTKDQTPAELFRDWVDSVVSVQVKIPGGLLGDRTGSGTGFFIDGAGTLATNHHVIEHASVIGIKERGKSDWNTNVEILAEDKAHDLVLLRLGNATAAKPVRLGDSDRITVGERILTIGNPLGLDYTLTDGLVSSRRVYDGRDMIQMSVPVSPGNSGGPLFNLRGEVIGIVTLQVLELGGRAQNLNMAMPTSALKALLSNQYPNRRKPGEAPPARTW